MIKQSVVQSSITKCTTKIVQPRGGYLNPNLFEQEVTNDMYELHENENLHPSLVGAVIDYLTRVMIGIPKDEAFSISILGADIFDKTYPETSQFKTQSATKYAEKLLASINTIDEQSIINACKLTGYDVCARSSIAGYKPIETINPDKNTIQNIATMVERSIDFWRNNNPVITAGLCFKQGYTKNITHGYSGYITEDTICDFRVSKNEINNRHTLCLLIEHIMGIHVYPDLFNKIEIISIYNPRLNKLYKYPLYKIKNETLLEIEEKIIGYDTSKLNI